MKRVRELDAVRGLGAAVVMIYHLRPQAFALEGIRVDLFLVLSGFLITSIVLDKADTPGFLATFHLRRSIRILPVYYLAILALAVVNPFLSRPFALQGLPYYATFTQNTPRLWGAEPPPFHQYFYHTWSLALEQQFYVLWPVAICLCRRSWLAPITVGLALMSLALRPLGVHWWLLPARCDGFAIGSLMALLIPGACGSAERLGRLRRGLGAATALAAALIVGGLAASESWQFSEGMTVRLSLVIFGFNLLFGSLVGLIAATTGHPGLRLLRDARLAYLGKISYGLYLFHPAVFVGVYGLGRALGLGEPLWLEAVKLAGCVAVASASWHFFERPIMAWRERFGYRAAGEAAARDVAEAPHSLAPQG